MKKYLAIICLMISCSVFSEPDGMSDETLGSIASSASTEALLINEIIKNIDLGEIEKARDDLCSNLDVHLMILAALTTEHPKIVPELVDASIKHIAKNTPKCDFSEDSMAVLNKYLNAKD